MAGILGAGAAEVAALVLARQPGWKQAESTGVVSEPPLHSARHASPPTRPGVVVRCGHCRLRRRRRRVDRAIAQHERLAELVVDVDVGGRTMQLVCVGQTDPGEPTILLEAGGGGDYLTWGEILPVMQSTHRLCAYDRAGLGQSEPPAEASRTAADQVADLRALLDAAGVSGPFVIGAPGPLFGDRPVVVLSAETMPGPQLGLPPNLAKTIDDLWGRRPAGARGRVDHGLARDGVWRRTRDQGRSAAGGDRRTREDPRRSGDLVAVLHEQRALIR